MRTATYSHLFHPFLGTRTRTPVRRRLPGNFPSRGLVRTPRPQVPPIRYNHSLVTLGHGADATRPNREAEAAKKAEAARKKAERDALLKEEEASIPARSTPKNSKTATKKTRGLDLSQLDDDGGSGGKALPALSASGIDDALDALSLTAKSDTKIERHPERRFKAAYAAFEERRLVEMERDGSGQGLRLNQRKERIKKEFEKSPENPFNQVTARYDASKEELEEIKEQERQKIESRLGFKG